MRHARFPATLVLLALTVPTAAQPLAVTPVHAPSDTSLIAFFSGAPDSPGDLLCTVPLDIQPAVIDFSRDDQSFNQPVACADESARSMVLSNVPAGRVLRLYADAQGRRTDDWLEVVVKRDIGEKAIPSFERSFADDDVTVVYHRNEGLDGRVSRLEIEDETSRPVIDLYLRNGGKGPLVCSILARYLRGAHNALDFASSDCPSNTARSLVLHDFRAGTVIRFFDSPAGKLTDDWVEIKVKRDLPRKVINSFETYFEDDDVLVRYFRKDGLDGQVSRVEIGERALASGGVWVGLSDGARFRTYEWADWSTTPDTKVLAGDFNGDGKTDVMKFDVPASGTVRLGLWVGLSDGTRFVTDRWEAWHNNARMKVLAGDFNGDGRTDVMKFTIPPSGMSKQDLWVGLSDGSKFNSVPWASWRTAARIKVLAGDFDGDGLTDVMKFDVPPTGTARQGLWVGLSNGSRFESARWAVWNTSSRIQVLAGDFNGDGRTDVLKLDPPSSEGSERNLWVGLSDGEKFEGTKWASWETDRDVDLIAGDFNGDGRTDVLRLDLPSRDDAEMTLWVALSNGAGFTTTKWGAWHSSRKMLAFAADFNGDGKTDLMQVEQPSHEGQESSAVRVAVSDGSRFLPQRWGGWLVDRTKGLVGDFNGDGLIDAVKFDVPLQGGD